MGQTFSEFFPPTPEWTVDDIPDLSGKVAIVTGGNTGIGKVTCQYLLLNNAKVYLAARSPEKAQSAIDDLKSITGKDDIHFLQLDLADLESVRAAAAEFQRKESRLHMLFNSAGVMNVPLDQLTKQGMDLQFGTNVIGHAYFTKLLLPTMIETAKTSAEGTVRVINTSAKGHDWAPAGGILWETLKPGPERDEKLTSISAYFQSKWANVVFAKQLARRYGKEGIISTAVNPGGTRTEVGRHSSAWAQTIFDRFIAYPADPYGALTQLYAGTAPEARKANGKYFTPWAREGKPRPDTENEEMGERLWRYIEEITDSL